MGTVHVRISHDDDLIITQFADVKVISVSFGKSTAKSLIIVLISAFASTLSILAFSTFRILPRIGRIAWNIRSLAVFAEPPAESPSTI